MGREGGGRARQETQEDQRRHRGTGKGAQLSGTAEQVRHHTEKSGRTATGTHRSFLPVSARLPVFGVVVPNRPVTCLRADIVFFPFRFRIEKVYLMSYTAVCGGGPISKPITSSSHSIIVSFRSPLKTNRKMFV